MTATLETAQTAYSFDDHAQSIAKRQYLQASDGDVYGMFKRIANWVSSAESTTELRAQWGATFYDLMASKRFCPGGRVLAGAGTQHGNVLNCFVQGATEFEPSSFEGVMEVAKKLALVTKVGGGNGVNLDVYTPRAASSRPDAGVRGWAYMSADHADVEDFIKGLMRPPTMPDGDKVPTVIRNWNKVIYGIVPSSVAALARQYGVTLTASLPAGVEAVNDDMGSIIDAAKEVCAQAKKGLEPRIDVTPLRAEGAPIKGSGGTSSGPVSFLFEIFDNFLEWANLGAETSGAVATLRYCYSPVLRVVRQGGCLHPDTLVNTDKGTLRLSELVDGLQRGHQRHDISVATDEGWKRSMEGFNNGIAQTKRVNLKNGLWVQGTPNHKLKVMREDGSRTWVRLDELKCSDHVIQVLDQHTGTPVTLKPLEMQHFNATPITTPETLSEDLAFFLGYFYGDGFVSTGGRIGLCAAHGSVMQDKAPAMFKDLFNLEVGTQQKPDDKSVVYVVKSIALYTWLEQNGLLKPKATDLRVPRAIRQAPRQVLGAFLRGLYEADGTLSHHYPELSSASRGFVEDVAVLLAGLGIPSTISDYAAREDRYSTQGYARLRVVSHIGLERFKERVGCTSGSRLAAMNDFTPDLDRESAWTLPHAQGLLQDTFNALPKGVKGNPSPVTSERKTLSRYMRGERQLTISAFKALQATATLEATLPEVSSDEYFVPVMSVTDAGAMLTLDICVEDNHTYLANGMVSHNTRRGAGMATISIDHADVLDFLTAKDLDREQGEGDISTFNISILATNKFLETLENDALWALKPLEVMGKYYVAPQTGEYTGTLPTLEARGADGAKAVPVYAGGVPAKWLWRQIAEHAWSTGEPGLIFNDRVNEKSAIAGLGEKYIIKSTNPCGEIPLTVGEPCDLGAINLAAYVQDKQFDFKTFRHDVRDTIRFLDDVLDVNVFALEDNRVASQNLRRLGLGVMGLADALILMGQRYDDQQGRDTIEAIMSAMREEAILESEKLGNERGHYPVYLEHAAQMPHAPRRNVAVLTVAPTGTTSMLMGVSSGIEPIFSPFIWRKIGAEYKALIAPLFQQLLEEYPAHPAYARDGRWDWDKVTDALSGNHGSCIGLEFVPEAVQSVFVCSHDIAPLDHVRMQGVVQRAFDAEGYAANSLSKTINMPNSATVEDIESAYTEAFKTGCKGITVYRDGSRQFQVLSVSKDEKKDTEQESDSSSSLEIQHVPSVSNESNWHATSTFQPGKPLMERPSRLTGVTDMVKLTDLAAGTKRTFLITTNTYESKPVEIVVVSGRAGDEANADSEALGRVVSIALQYGVPVEAIQKTLRGINGGLYGSYNGRLVASKADLIAVALESTGGASGSAFKPAEQPLLYPSLIGAAPSSDELQLPLEPSWNASVTMKGETCPSCSSPNLVREEGCLKCQSCGYSKCG